MRDLALLVVFAAIMVSCSSGAGNVTVGKDVPVQDAAEVGAAELVPEQAPFDPGRPQETVEPEVGFEVAEEVGPACQPGQGCFLDTCAGNEDCLSGWCVEHMGEGVCSQECQEECLEGWTCKPVSTGGPDMVSLCVSPYANLCRPCAGSADCKAGGGVEDVCVAYGEEGSFCGGPCMLVGQQGVEPCPWGFTCKAVETVEGVETQQCVADAGECPCTAKSVALALTTPCVVANEFGECEGKRTCAVGGLTPCDAGVPGAETCDGKDEDCDGQVDEPAEVGGDFVNLCDDGNPCTKDVCAGEAGCTHESLLSGECLDGDPCTKGDHCEQGVCVGLPADCDDGNPCTDDSCDEVGGCIATPNGKDCDDGEVCTVGDHCSAGVCAGAAVDCECSDSDPDCEKALGDGNLCNGTLYCNMASVPYQCDLKPGSAVVCPDLVGLEAECNEAVCDPLTGACGKAPANDGQQCSDGDVCTVGDTCAGGACIGGKAAVCVDGNVCTDDYCDPAFGCQFAPNSLACTDDNVCTTGDVCMAGKCVGAGLLVCDDGNGCTDDACEPGVGCVSVPNAAECSDGNACTVGDHCEGGQCAFEGLDDCNDGNVCTTDACDAAQGCVHSTNSAVCDDGSVCTTGDHCKFGMCIAGTPLVCDDGNVCTDDVCDGKAGCVFKANAAQCSDGNPCTVVDACAGGKCVGSGVLGCDDGDPCTDDSCDPGKGCVHALNVAVCDDGNVCTTGDHCQLGTCIGAGKLLCDDGNLCTDDACDGKVGCQFKPNKAPCDDGSVCTTSDACDGGWCKGGVGVSCDDGSECTSDWCDNAKGCQHSAVAGACTDGSVCTVGDHCVNGACEPGAPIPCDDSNGCTDDVCDKVLGCVFAPNAAACDDKDACTLGDVCGGGKCTPGPNKLVCDDGNACTQDSCLPASGCSFASLPDGTVCGVDKKCVGGQCLSCGELHGSQVFSPTGTVQTFTVPMCITTVTVEAWGAQGGTANGGKGARMKGTFTVAAGELLKVVVGEQGTSDNCGGYPSTGGGGGGSFVWHDNAPGSPMIAAGGGGGGNVNWGNSCSIGLDGVTGANGTKGNGANSAEGGTGGNGGFGNAPSGTGSGGGGWKTKGQDSTYGGGCTGGLPYPSFAGGKGGSSHGPGGDGGFGGGGGCVCGAGGGGGYSGGGAGEGSSCRAGGGGGGSYNAGTNPDNAGGVQSGPGKVVITW